MHTEGRSLHSAHPTAPQVRHVRLGNVDINRIGLGTNRLRDTDEDVAFIRSAVDLGVQMIDTAHLYTGGESEKTIGRALSTRPSGVVIATKGGYGGAGRGRPEALRREIEQSLASLRVDHIGLYYLHRVDPETPIEESLGAIKDYVDKGAIERVGVSKVDIPLIERARTVVPIAAVQNEYNVAERTDDDVVDYCAREGIVFVPYYPLGVEPGRALRETAKRHQATPQQVMLAWLLKRSPAMLPIPGTLSLAHLQENLGALALELSEAEFRTIAFA
ncbi:MAG TPA: aldo/keto reductase [Gemmatimonadaceae bacterium]|nr:aldo/keto reductase [Gemmatimonadaceae bacterium]